MAAYGSAYRIAASAAIWTASLSYRFPLNKKLLDVICLYNDFSLLHKRADGFNDSRQNVTGCSLERGNLLVQIDCAVGKNQAWLGGVWEDAFARGTADNRGLRFNINLGYYF